MKKRSKKYTEAFSKIDKHKVYTKEEAIKLVKETSISKFDSSIEIAMRLNLDTKKADQQLRGAIVLPKGTGKNVRVLVIAKGENAKKAQKAGADFVGDVDMIEKIEKIVEKQVDAIKNIKFDKITVWDGGTGSSNGSTTANFMKDLIKALPAMHDLAGQAGIELPQILGKVDSGVEEAKVVSPKTEPKK